MSREGVIVYYQLDNKWMNQAIVFESYSDVVLSNEDMLNGILQFFRDVYHIELTIDNIVGFVRLFGFDGKPEELYEIHQLKTGSVTSFVIVNDELFKLYAKE